MDCNDSTQCKVFTIYYAPLFIIKYTFSAEVKLFHCMDSCEGHDWPYLKFLPSRPAAMPVRGAIGFDHGPRARRTHDIPAPASHNSGKRCRYLREVGPDRPPATRVRRSNPRPRCPTTRSSDGRSCAPARLGDAMAELPVAPRRRTGNERAPPSALPCSTSPVPHLRQAQAERIELDEAFGVGLGHC